MCFRLQALQEQLAAAEARGMALKGQMGAEGRSTVQVGLGTSCGWVRGCRGFSVISVCVCECVHVCVRGGGVGGGEIGRAHV